MHFRFLRTVLTITTFIIFLPLSKTSFAQGPRPVADSAILFPENSGQFNFSSCVELLLESMHRQEAHFGQLSPSYEVAHHICRDSVFGWEPARCIIRCSSAFPFAIANRWKRLEPLCSFSRSSEKTLDCFRTALRSRENRQRGGLQRAINDCATRNSSID